jgi:hypothetical protein
VIIDEARRAGSAQLGEWKRREDAFPTKQEMSERWKLKRSLKSKALMASKKPKHQSPNGPRHPFLEGGTVEILERIRANAPNHIHARSPFNVPYDKRQKYCTVAGVNSHEDFIVRLVDFAKAVVIAPPATDHVVATKVVLCQPLVVDSINFSHRGRLTQTQWVQCLQGAADFWKAHDENLAKCIAMAANDSRFVRKLAANPQTAHVLLLEKNLIGFFANSVTVQHQDVGFIAKFQKYAVDVFQNRERSNGLLLRFFVGFMVNRGGGVDQFECSINVRYVHACGGGVGCENE